MKKRVHFYINPKNGLVWVMTLFMLASCVLRLMTASGSGAGYVWGQLVLPIAAALLYVAFVLLEGQELFYKTAIPAWMMAIYSGLWVNEQEYGTMMGLLFWIALIFFAVLYTEITAGVKGKAIFLLPLLELFCCVFILYFNREALAAGEYLAAAPDLLVILGAFFLSFAIRIHPVDEYHPTWGDRTDGRRIRSLPPMAQVSSYFMVTRNTSTNYFSESFEISHIDRYIRQKRKEGLTNFGITHVFLAAYCRAVCRYPGLNRFSAGQKVYSRGNDIQYCMTIKKEMRSDSPDTVIKVHLTPFDTAEDVYRKMNAEVEKVKHTPLDADFDNAASAFNLIPGVFLKFAIWLLKTLDYFGLLPRFLLEVSPFHGSLFFTSMGSLGIPPIYHHLYDFGNLPVFGSFGCKRRAVELDENGEVRVRKYVDFKFCMDERIVDGYYYAAFFKHYKRIIQHPEVMDRPPTPEEVIPDID